jgi:hypothetical protein
MAMALPTGEPHGFNVGACHAGVGRGWPSVVPRSAWKTVTYPPTSRSGSCCLGITQHPETYVFFLSLRTDRLRSVGPSWRQSGELRASCSPSLERTDPQ